jgi:hypothetical protein
MAAPFAFRERAARRGALQQNVLADRPGGQGTYRTSRPHLRQARIRPASGGRQDQIAGYADQFRALGSFPAAS